MDTKELLDEISFILKDARHVEQEERVELGALYNMNSYSSGYNAGYTGALEEVIELFGQLD